MKVSLSLRFFLAGALTVLSACVLSAQSSFVGGVRGLIQDPGGAVIPNAKVTLLNKATGVSRATVSNAQGEYDFPQVEPATYSLTVEAPGFKKAEQGGVIVNTQAFLTVDIKMEIGEATQSVQVSAEAPLLENSNASTGQVLDTQKLTDLPNLGRNPFLMSKLSIGVVPVGDPRFNRMQDQSGSSQISIDGGPVRGNNYLIDGIPVTDSTNKSVIIPSLEAVQEMKLQEGTYDATMGRTGGGVFNTVLKTGTNDLHLDLFGYLRETDWTANTFFNNAAGIPRSQDNWKNFGGYIGGPVIIPKLYNGKNKTFFFVAQEAYRENEPLTNSWAVPTAQERVGNFSQSSVVVYNPFSSTTCTASSNCPAGVTTIRTPFPGNIIPASMLNPVGLAIASYLPLPTVSGVPTGSNNYTNTATLFNRADQYDYKVEHSVTDWFRLTGSFMYYKSREPGGNTLGTEATGGSAGPYLLYRRVDATAINGIITANPTTVISIRYGFNRFPNITYGVSYGFNPATLGFPASYTNALQANYFPEIGLIDDSYAISSTSPSFSTYWSKNTGVSVSKYIGRHNITAGFDYRLIHADFLSLTNTAGAFAFNGVFSREFPQTTNGTGSDFADLVMGFPATSEGSVTSQVQTSTKLYMGYNYFAGYVQDDIRATNKLTVNIGLRYEYSTGLSENNNALAVAFNESAINPIAANVTGLTPHGVIEYAGVNGNPTSCCNPSKFDFAPRIGLAYQLDSKTTLRGGWGIFYVPYIFQTNANLAPGFTQTTPYVASNNGNSTPATSLSNPFPNGILQPVGNTLGALTDIGSSFTFLDQNANPSGIVNQFSADIQRELPGQVVLEVGYFGSRSHNLQVAPTSTSSLFINQVPTQYLSMGSALAAPVANPFYGHGGAGVVGNATVSEAQLLMPYPEFGAITEVTNTGKAQYDSMIIKAQKRLSAGLTFLGSFTWARTEDNMYGSGAANNLQTFSNSGLPSEPQNYYNLGAEWGLASQDTPLRFTGAWTYELPFGQGKRFLNSNHVLNYFVGGWSSNATFIYQTGFPLFIYQQNLNSVIGTGEQRPNATGISPAMPGSVEQRINDYINPAAFSLAPAYTFGNLSRSINYLGPGEKNWDTSLFKTVAFKEKYSIQFRAEALNVFNSPLFANPVTQFGNPNFGKINYQANFPRQIQLGIRFFF